MQLHANGTNYLLLWDVLGQRAINGGQDQHQPRDSGLTVRLQTSRGAGSIAHVQALPVGGSVKMNVQGRVQAIKVCVTNERSHRIRNGLGLIVPGLHKKVY